MSNQRLYHVISVNEKTGNKTYMTRYPMPHNEACNVLKAQMHGHWKQITYRLEQC